MPDQPNRPDAEPAAVPPALGPVAPAAAAVTPAAPPFVAGAATAATESVPPAATVSPAPDSPGEDLPQPTGERCGNCGAVLFGEHCYRCGQPDHGLVRHFSSVLGDFADTVLQIDTRLTRTLAPLLLRPGFLSSEYFAGRRVR